MSLARPGNVRRERQLETGACDSVRAMGVAFRALQLKVSCVRSSSAFRAREASELAGFGEPTEAPELDEVPCASPGGAPAKRLAAGAIRATTTRRH